MDYTLSRVSFKKQIAIASYICISYKWVSEWVREWVSERASRCFMLYKYKCLSFTACCYCLRHENMAIHACLCLCYACTKPVNYLICTKYGNAIVLLQLKVSKWNFHRMQIVHSRLVELTSNYVLTVITLYQFNYEYPWPATKWRRVVINVCSSDGICSII